MQYYSFGSVSYTLVFLVCTIIKEEITEGRKDTDSVIFSHCFAFSSYTYVVVTCAIVLELYYYAVAVTSFLLLPSWPGRMSNALARLLTLRLPSLGWVSSEPFILSLTVLRLYP